MAENREPHPAPCPTDQYGQRLHTPLPDPQHTLDRLGRGAHPQQPTTPQEH